MDCVGLRFAHGRDVCGQRGHHPARGGDGRGAGDPVRVRLAGAGVLVAPTRWSTSPPAATGSRRWTCVATAAARCQLEVERYTLRELAGDVAAVAAALSDEPIILFGHDWGTPIVWNAAIRYPDRVRAVAGLSVPHTPAMPFSLLDLFDQMYADQFLLHAAFPAARRDRGAVRRRHCRPALKRVYFAVSGDAPYSGFYGSWPRRRDLPQPAARAARWTVVASCSDDDLDVVGSRRSSAREWSAYVQPLSRRCARRVDNVGGHRGCTGRFSRRASSAARMISFAA